MDERAFRAARRRANLTGGVASTFAEMDDIDLAQPVGSRITKLTYDGVDVDPAARFVVAINNYRQSGGGGFPGVTDAPVVYNAQLEIRQTIIDWVTDKGVIDPVEFTNYDWRLVAGGTPIKVEGASEGGRH